MSEAAPQPDARLEAALPQSLISNVAFEEKRKLAHRPGEIVTLAWAIRVSAAINFIASMLRHEPKVIYWLGSWVPFEISEGRRILMLLTSVLLFMVASGLERGKRSAWWLTVGALTIAPILHLGRAVVWPQALMNIALIGFLYHRRRYFVARSDQRSIWTAVFFSSLSLAALLTFGVVRLHVLHKYTSGDHSWMGCLQTACELALVQNTDTQRALTLQTLHLFSVLRVGGASIALIGLLLTLRPVLLRSRPPLEEWELARELIDRHGRDPFDSYALLDDKSYFFTSDNRVVVPYVLSSNLAVSLADPIGPPALHLSAIAEFTIFCRRQDWEPVFYEVTEELTPHYERAGFAVFKIGEEARLRGDQFHLKGGDFQNLRTACNRAHKLGLQFRWYHADDGIDEAFERQLAHVSERWLVKKKAHEMTFDMGSYSLADIRKHGVCAAVDPAGKLLAFATWRPFGQDRGRALDLMRSLPEARNVMDFVLVESILHFHERGIDDISLGAAPLANAGEGGARLQAEDKVVQFLFENLNRIYGYKSLFEFKRKYRPQWRGRYVAYRRGVRLPLVGLALVRVHAPEGIWKFLVG